MVKIGYEGGGETPNELKGVYTSETVARRKLEHYLTKQRQNG